MMILHLIASLVGVQPVAEAKMSWQFDSPEEIRLWAFDVTGDAKRRMPQPKVENGRLTLLESWMKSSAAVALPFESEEIPERFEVAWSLVMNTGTEGMGLAWVDVTGGGFGTGSGVPAPMPFEQSRDPGGNAMIPPPKWSWEAPNLRGAFGVGIDASNPVNRDPFGGSGNIMDRPQHEMSLHWDGLEIIKKTTATEFRDEKPHKVRVSGEYVTGGAVVTLTLDDEVVFDRFFIAGMMPFAGRAVFGAANGDTSGDVLLDDVSISTFGVRQRAPAPHRVVVMDRVLNDQSRGENKAEVDLPTSTEEFGRIIATLRLDKPETRFDPWDRIAHVFVEDLDGSNRTELIRYITPYHRGFEWKVDVTDLRPLLMGKKRIVQACGTYGEGWLVSVALDYYPGPTQDGLIAEKVINLWNGHPVIGDPANPPEKFYEARSFTLEPWVAAAKVRVTVTGHGMSPNTNNAAEFMPLERTLKANGAEFKNNLWKMDNYLNPCRPQGGTWKYDRAGWAPGDVALPWTVDVTKTIGENRELKLEYILAPYVNDARGQTSAPTHATQSQLVLFRRVAEKISP